MRAMISRENAAIVVMFVLVSLWSIAFQPQNNVNGYDGMFYLNMAQTMAHGQPVTGPVPWIYRVGTPFLAAIVAPITGDMVAAFKLVNIAASLLTTLLLAVYLRRHVGSMYARLIVMFLYLTMWHAPVRFAYFYPTSVDFWLMAFVLAALLLGDMIREKYADGVGAQRAAPLLVLLSVVIFVGVLFREVVAVFGVAALFIGNPLIFGHNPTYIRRINLSNFANVLPFLAAIAGIFVSHALVVVNQEGYPYTFDGTIYLWLYDKRLMTYLLAWFVAFGPLLALVLYNWRRAVEWLSQRQDVAVFVLAIVVLAWVGGTDTERFLYWAMPIFYVLLGKALEDHGAWLRRSQVLVTVLVATQLLTQRFLLPTPDFNTLTEPQIFPLLTVLGTDTAFEHLQTFYSTLRWQSISFALTVQHVALLAILLLWMSIVAGRWKHANRDEGEGN
ncbi:MAG: hypothetical protein H7175_27605 [Burkholderiales bacterium]|nr:hypothetical protein [Anaerolineae bacterium]